MVFEFIIYAAYFDMIKISTPIIFFWHEVIVARVSFVPDLRIRYAGDSRPAKEMVDVPQEAEHMLFMLYQPI